MKYLAHLENNINSKIISVYDVKKGLNSNNPEKWEKKEYYSLWKLKPMKAVVNKQNTKPHFAYKNGGGGNENSGTGESIEHQLSKKIIYDMKSINIKMGETEDVLNFSEVLIEKPFNDGKYISDIYAKIERENKFDFPVNSYLVIEIHKTNRVTLTKQQFFRNNNIAAIEIKLFDEIKFDNDLDKLQRQLTGYFSKQRFAKNLHDPNYIKHKKEREEFEKTLKKQEIVTPIKQVNVIVPKVEEPIKEKTLVILPDNIESLNQEIQITNTSNVNKISIISKIIIWFESLFK